MAWRIDAFRDPADFYADLAALLGDLRETPVSPIARGRAVLVPGDPERDAEIASRRLGVPLAPPVVEELRALAASEGLPFDLLPVG